MSLIEICNHRKITINPDDISCMTIDKAYGQPTRLLIRFRTGREMVVTTEHQQPAIDAEQVYAKLLSAATMFVSVPQSHSDERVAQLVAAMTDFNPTSR